jgi:FtsZ-binding cell division protein ZapB
LGCFSKPVWTAIQELQKERDDKSNRIQELEDKRSSLERECQDFQHDNIHLKREAELLQIDLDRTWREHGQLQDMNRLQQMDNVDLAK